MASHKNEARPRTSVFLLIDTAVDDRALKKQRDDGSWVEMTALEKLPLLYTLWEPENCHHRKPDADGFTSIDGGHKATMAEDVDYAAVDFGTITLESASDTTRAHRAPSEEKQCHAMLVIGTLDDHCDRALEGIMELLGREQAQEREPEDATRWAQLVHYIQVFWKVREEYKGICKVDMVQELGKPLGVMLDAGGIETAYTIEPDELASMMRIIVALLFPVQFCTANYYGALLTGRERFESEYRRLLG